MKIITTDDFIGMLPGHAWARHFTVLGYKDGGFSSIPKNFFSNWLEEEPTQGNFQIGRCSGIGVGSIAKYDDGPQQLVIGKYVAGGLRLRFLLNGQHETRTMSICMLGLFGNGLQHARMPQYGDTIIQNDVWIGDEAMFLGGSTVENGCVIGARALVPPNFRSEAYGIYVGSPARLVRFRFTEKVREKLLELAWWDMPLSWIKANNAGFLSDLTADEGRSLEILSELLRNKQSATVATTNLVTKEFRQTVATATPAAPAKKVAVGHSMGKKR